MLISLDVITRKKLILVKQIYQRALIQSQFTHRAVDRMLAVVGFDLANETVLKTIAVTLNPTIKLKHPFPEVIKQVDDELAAQGKKLTDVTHIQYIHKIRNDAQHYAKYPSEIEVSDSRTYTRDFLMQTFSDVWGESFESISLADVIENVEIKNLLLEAEGDFAKDDFTKTAVKSMVAFQKIIGGVADLLTERVGSWSNGIVITKTSGKPESNSDILRAFIRTRELIVFQTIGINPQEFLKYKRMTNYIGIAIAQAGNYTVNFNSDRKPTEEETDYVLNFVINSVIQIEGLDEDITKAYDRFS
jgi:hypothetical protein